MRKITKKITKKIKEKIHNGLSTHNQLHLITPNSFKVINTMVNNPIKPIPPLLLLLLFIYFSFSSKILRIFISSFDIVLISIQIKIRIKPVNMPIYSTFFPSIFAPQSIQYANLLLILCSQPHIEQIPYANIGLGSISG